MKKLFIYSLLVIFITSCATAYQPTSFSGGFTDTQLSENVWKVSVNGNAYTSKSTIGDYALLRASELTLQKGFKYFVVGSQNEDSKKFNATFGTNSSTTYGNISSSGNFNARTNYTTPTVVPMKKHSNEIIFEMLHKKEDGVFTYNAQLIYDQLASKHMK
jgi:hypothetical protein